MYRCMAPSYTIFSSKVPGVFHCGFILIQMSLFSNRDPPKQGEWRYFNIWQRILNHLVMCRADGRERTVILPGAHGNARRTRTSTYRKFSILYVLFIEIWYQAGFRLATYPAMPKDFKIVGVLLFPPLCREQAEQAVLKSTRRDRSWKGD